MKRTKRLLYIFLASFTVLTGMPGMPQNAQAATKTTTQKASHSAKKKNGWYNLGGYKKNYYQNGKKLIGTWKTIDGDRYFLAIPEPRLWGREESMAKCICSGRMRNCTEEKRMAL